MIIIERWWWCLVKRVVMLVLVLVDIIFNIYCWSENVAPWCGRGWLVTGEHSELSTVTAEY